MAQSSTTAWESELRILLDKIRHHPSSNLESERRRVVVLERLIAGTLRAPA